MLLAPRSMLLLLFLALCSVLIAPVAWGQGALDKTTLGKSQNDGRDLVNSLVPGAQKYGKGEKKEEVDPRTLQSKSIKDPTFGGSLVEMGLGSSGDPDVHLGKSRSANNADSKAPKKNDGGENDSKVSQPENAANDKDSKASKSTDSTGDGLKKDQKAEPSKSDEKASDKEKSSASKPDGNH